MNIFYHHPTYIGVQKIQNLYLTFIICSLCHFDQVMYYKFY